MAPLKYPTTRFTSQTGSWEVSTEQELATIVDGQNLGLPEYVDVLKVTAAFLGETAIGFSFETRGPILPEGNPVVESLFYRSVAFVGSYRRVSPRGLER